MAIVKRYWKEAFASILAAELVGLLGFLAAGDTTAFYRSLARPPGAAPSWLFGVVWPILYVLMGFAAFLVYREPAARRPQYDALKVYFIQLAVNVVWCIVFFRLHLLWGGFLVLLALLALVLVTVARFTRVNRTAGGLLIPYFIWILYAAYLNLGIALLN